MSLTLGGGPLAGDRPETVNYHLEGPDHLLFAQPFPRRVRATFAGRTVLDSDRGMLVHETGLLPVLYVPFEDLAAGLLKPSDHRTHCPFKGDASYWSLHVGDKAAENAVWAYEEPMAQAHWLRGMAALYFKAADAWYDEAEEVRGHLRDPYHRVDIRETRDLVRVSLGTQSVALSGQAKVLSETGLPNCYYFPREQVRAELARSATRTVCPYKGETVYYDVRVGERVLADAAWCYPHPLQESAAIADHICFRHDELDITVERQP